MNKIETGITLAPDLATIKAHLHALFSPAFVHPYPDAWIEITCLREGTSPKAMNYSVFDIENAAEFAAANNAEGYNVYVGAALRQGKEPRTGRARKQSYLTSAFAWAEFDGAGDDERINAILKQHGLQPALVVITGTVPHRRAHLYFKISGIDNFEQQEAVNSSLQHVLGSDNVSDACRIMRLAGSINYPTDKKRQERGYVAELTTLIEHRDAPTYRPEQLLKLTGTSPTDSRNAFEIYGEQNVQHPGKSGEEITALLKQSRATPGKGWREPMLKAIGSMIGKGWSDDQIKIACAPYSDGGFEDRDIAKLISDTRKKFGKLEPRPDTEQPTEERPNLRSCTLTEVHEVFRRWLGDDYDIEALDAVLATAASERLPGDPAWLLVISGSGNAKTETVQSVAGLGAHIVSTISSDGALLSASSKRTRAKNATGGLLRKIGERGILVVKDVTSILSTSREIRGAILAALREIHDGRWVRNVGTDGGQTLEWQGRIVLIGACTTAWDAAHAVVASMGDRFVTIRANSRKGRFKNGLQAMRNTGSESGMRQEMAEAVSGLIGTISTEPYILTEDDEVRIVKAAELVTLARTGVETDYRGDVIDAHDPEAPTRLAKQLTQIMRGAMAIGMPHDDALRLVIRCAKDSMPQLRLAVLTDVADNPNSPVMEVRRRLQKPRLTIDRTLQALHILGLLVCNETELNYGGKVIQHRKYELAEGIDIDPLEPPSTPPATLF